jgi:hypothetical protein
VLITDLRAVVGWCGLVGGWEQRAITRASALNSIRFDIEPPAVMSTGCYESKRVNTWVPGI